MRLVVLRNCTSSELNLGLPSPGSNIVSRSQAPFRCAYALSPLVPSLQGRLSIVGLIDARAVPEFFLV